MYRYEIIVKSKFSSAHRVLLPNNELEPLHGHNYNVEVCIKSNKLNDKGMVIDFVELRNILESITSRFNYKYLNELETFKNTYPTAENIARYIFEALSEKIKGPDTEVSYVRVDETDEFSVIIRK